MTPPALRLGIDASNIRMGGGLTHLVETLAHADPAAAGFGRVTVWAPRATLDRLPVRDWLRLEGHEWLDGPLPARAAWQTLQRTPASRRAADVLFVPGGSYSGSFRPFVTFAQSMLPFDDEARKRYPPSWMRLRNTIVRSTQEKTFRRADGLIYLTEYDRLEIEREIGGSRARTVVIPYGATPGIVRKQGVAVERGRPFRWLYMSTIDMYKHHPELVEAAAALKREGHDLQLDFVGPEYPPAAAILERAMAAHDPAGEFVRKLGSVPPARVKTIFAEYDASIFASSCESFGIPLLDALGAALPTACSNLSTMPGIARDAVVYFDPRDPRSAADAMRSMMRDEDLRGRLAERGPPIFAQYDWTKSAAETMQFLAGFVKGARGAAA